MVLFGIIAIALGAMWLAGGIAMLIVGMAKKAVTKVKEEN